jgi:hypothetical protein
MRIALLTSTLFLLAATAGAAEQSLSVDKMIAWQIVCDPDATACERYAAAEFQTLFREMTDAKLPIVAKAPAGLGAVFIGRDAVVRADQQLSAEKLGEEGLRITVANNAVCIDGGRPRGTLYGVYEFFEEFCGARYLTYDHTYFPSDAKLRAIPLGSRTHVPAFAFRWSYYGETNRNPAFAARLRVNTVSDDPKLGGRTGYRLVGHNVAYLVPPAKYGATHPEYYALVNGQRRLDMGGGGPQLCTTNPDVVNLVTEAVLAEIKKNPTAKNINIAQMDNESYCTCANCAAIDAREESHAGAHLTLVNAVAERVEQLYPEVLIGTFAYQYTRKPPKTLQARHNVMIQLCSIECCDFHAIDDPSCPLNRIFCDDMAIWKTKADALFIWHYNTNFSGYILPFPNLRSIGKSVAFFAKNNGRGVFMQAAGNGFSTELSDLRNYVMARCLWKPGRDSWQEAEEFCRLHYGEAAQPILDYLVYFHDRIGAAGVHPTCFPTESALTLDQHFARRVFAYFREAMGRAKSAAVRSRIEKASLCAYRAALSGSSMQRVYVDGVCRPDLAGLEPDLMDRYAKLCERYGVTMENEETPLAEYLQKQGKFFTEGLKAVRLENDIWRLIVLPEWNGKIVEMTYKPAGRNIIRALRALSRFRYEDWVRQGVGPSSHSMLPFQARVKDDEATLTLAASDGTRFERRIRLTGDAIRIEMAIAAGADRRLDLQVHPEYDTVTASNDPRIIALYVKSPQWRQVNREWGDGMSHDEQVAALSGAVTGGAFAYYNHHAGFGVEQRFDPQQFSSLGLFWNPSRLQINLEMFPKIMALKKGEQARYAYEVRYLKEPPAAP